MVVGEGPRSLARRIRIGPAFRPTLDFLGITRDTAAQAAVGRVVARLAVEALPAEDTRVRVFLMPTPDREVLGWSRRVLGYGFWIVYSFDEDEVAALAVTDRRPIPVPES